MDPSGTVLVLHNMCALIHAVLMIRRKQKLWIWRNNLRAIHILTVCWAWSRWKHETWFGWSRFEPDSYRGHSVIHLLCFAIRSTKVKELNIPLHKHIEAPKSHLLQMVTNCCYTATYKVATKEFVPSTHKSTYSSVMPWKELAGMLWIHMLSAISLHTGKIMLTQT